MPTRETEEWPPSVQLSYETKPDDDGLGPKKLAVSFSYGDGYAVLQLGLNLHGRIVLGDLFTGQSIDGRRPKPVTADEPEPRPKRRRRPKKGENE